MLVPLNALPAIPGALGKELLPEGTRVRVVALDGGEQVLEYRGLDVDRGSARVVLQGSDGRSTDLALDGVRAILFPPFRPDPGLLASPEAVSVFEFRYRDQRVLRGFSRWLHSDESGVHLLRAGEGWLQRVLVPWSVVNELRLHPQSQVPDALRPASPGGPSAAARLVLEGLDNRADPGDHTLHIEPSGKRTDRDQGMGGTAARREAQLAQRLGLEFVEVRGVEPGSEVLDEVPVDYCRTYHVMPLALIDGRLRVAMSDPTQVEATSLLQFLTGKRLDIVVASRVQIDIAIERAYAGMAGSDSLAELDMEHGKAQTSDAERERNKLEQLSMQKPVVRLVNSIIIEAIRRRASDIHIRPAERDVELVFRIDGEMVPVRRFAKALLAAVVSRIKIIGGMNITERRIPQDGQTRIRDAQRVVDLRISVIPTIEGESVVMRLLNASVDMLGLDQLGLSKADLTRMRDGLHRSNGLILVTGPTGSGKSTTLYSALRTVIERGVNIITVENPVEFHIPGIEQVAINTEVGLSFAKALRNILRHDPDVIMVGEIRDQETARIAVESSLTGHLVLSTLHTNSASRSIARLLEMGVDAYLLRATLIAILAQRLVRVNCTECSEKELADPIFAEALGVASTEHFVRGQGCDHCNGLGVKGRRMTYELLTMNQELRALVADGVPSEQIDAAAIAAGMVPLTEHALALARDGVIPLSEVYRTRLD